MKLDIRLPGLAPLLLLASVLVLALLIILPLGVVFQQAFAKGLAAYLAPLREPDAQAAIRLTLLVAAIAVPLNAVFGLAAAWTVARFEFRGKTLLLALIDLPFSISPVVSGLVWVLLFEALRAAPARCCRPGASRSSSPRPAWCWRPSSSHYPLWRAN